MAGFLARSGYSGRTPTAMLLAKLRGAPLGRAGEREVEAKRSLVLGLVAVLRPLVEQIRLIASQVAQAVRVHPDGPVFLSLFRSPDSTITAARLVAEIGDERSRYPTDQALAADAGSARSPSSRAAAARPSFAGPATCVCATRSRPSPTPPATTTPGRARSTPSARSGVRRRGRGRHHHHWARAVYAWARERGCRHEHAIRILGRAWLRVIWRMWQNRQSYDPARHRNLQRLLGAGSPPTPAGTDSNRTRLRSYGCSARAARPRRQERRRREPDARA